MRLVKYLNRFTAYSIYPIELKLETEHQSAQSCGAGFFISYEGKLWGRAVSNVLIVSQPTVRIRLSSNVVGRYRTSIRTIARSWIFRFPFGGAVMARHLKFSNRFPAYSNHPISLKPSRMILDICPLIRSDSDFPISPIGRCWGRHSINFKTDLVFRYSIDWCKIWYHDIRRQSVQSLGVGFFDCASVPKSISSFGIWSIDLKRYTMILEVILQNRLVANFSVPQRMLLASLFDYRFSSPIIGLIQLNHARMIPDSPRNRLGPN